jgi:hypothetical protein
MLQTPSPTPPAQPTLTIPGGDNAAPITIQIPRTARDIAVIRAQRSELSSQLSNIGSRRTGLARQLRTETDPVARAGIESRISLLDKRMLQLETQLDQTGQVLTSAPAALIATTQPTNNMFGISPDVYGPLGGVFIVFVMGPIAIGFARMMWKRSSRPVIPAAVPETAARLGRLEQSVDAIAVEVERITEGQRFITRLLSESRTPALPAADRQGETVRVQSP